MKNIIVIGAGPAGEAAARTIRSLTQKPGNKDAGANITLVEKAEAGGVCLNRGCIPSKSLLEQIHSHFERNQVVDWEKIQQAKAHVISGIRAQLENSLKLQKIHLIRGTASFKDSKTLHIENNGVSQDLPFDKVLIATGSEIFFPPPLDQFKEELLDSTKVLELKETPKSVVIVGGGAVGLEFACLLNAAGTRVAIIELQNQILPGEDPNVVSLLNRAYASRGIEIRINTKVEGLEKTLSGWKLSLSTRDTIEAEHVISCVGRNPNPSALSPEKADIQIEKNRIVINNFQQTSNPNVYAAGDVTTTRLAHAAAAQAEAAAANLLGDSKTYDGSLIPRCLYSWPEVASVGLAKYQRDEEKLPVKTSRAFYKASGKALAAGEPEGFVQLVFDPETDKLLGCQIIGSHATELIHIVAVAIKAGMTKSQLGDVIFGHPTLHELNKDAAKK